MESSDGWSSHGDEEEAVGERESIGIKAWEGDKSDCTSVDPEEDEEEEDGDSWDDELQSFLEESPEYRAKVQYQVRVVALIPGFEALGSKVSAFSHFYKLRFGKSLLENTGFSSAEILCRSMPHVIQRPALDKQGEVLLVESYKNMRSVAGIRSGLRRVVFQVLRQHPKGISAASLDKECSALIGRPLSMVLTELAYDTPNVECMVRDMADIASYRGISGVFLSSEAEDPALTDGILLQHSGPKVENLSPDGQTVAVSSNDVMQARFRTAVLLALHSDGIDMNRLQKTYAEAYTETLDCRLLGFSSVAELVRDWDDIVLLKDSSVPQKIFLRPTRDICRLLGTLSSGLRLAVFSILLKCYPDGLEPALVLSQLHEAQHEQIVAMYGSSKSSRNTVHDKEDLTLHAFCLMVQDMMDFIDFGCLEDGTLILKLRDAGFPLVDFPDFTNGDEFVELLVEGGGGNAIVESSENGASRRYTEQEDSEACEQKLTAVVEQRIRLIMSCFSDGLPLEEFLSVYKDRSGQVLTIVQLRELVSRTPGLLRMVRGRMWLVESPKNLRIVQATKAGLRQLLYWALLHNPGGLWSALFQGWFTDFTSYSLAKVLLKLGYTGLSPVDDFLQDMSDICSTSEENEGSVECYFLNESFTEDPTVNDSMLTGFEAEYQPVKLCMEIEGGSLAQSDEDDEQLEDEANGNEYQPPKAYVDETD